MGSYPEEFAPEGRGGSPPPIELCGPAAPMPGAPAISALVSDRWRKVRSSAGVRRIEALTGDAARFNHLTRESRICAPIAGLLKTSVDVWPRPRLASVLEERRKLRNAISRKAPKEASPGREAASDSAAEAVRDVAGVKFLGPHR